MIDDIVLPGHRTEGDWILVPLEDLTTPKTGRICRGPAYWLMVEPDQVLFYKRYTSPQCNSDKTVVEHILQRSPSMYPDTRVVYIEMAFVPHKCSDYN